MERPPTCLASLPGGTQRHRPSAALSTGGAGLVVERGLLFERGIGTFGRRAPIAAKTHENGVVPTAGLRPILLAPVGHDPERNLRHRCSGTGSRTARGAGSRCGPRNTMIRRCCATNCRRRDPDAASRRQRHRYNDACRPSVSASPAQPRSLMNVPTFSKRSS